MQSDCLGLCLPPSPSIPRKTDSRYFCSDKNRMYRGQLEIYHMSCHRPILLEYGRPYVADVLHGKGNSIPSVIVNFILIPCGTFYVLSSQTFV